MFNACPFLSLMPHNECHSVCLANSFLTFCAEFPPKGHTLLTLHSPILCLFIIIIFIICVFQFYTTWNNYALKRRLFSAIDVSYWNCSTLSFAK